MTRFSLTFLTLFMFLFWGCSDDNITTNSDAKEQPNNADFYPPVNSDIQNKPTGIAPIAPEEVPAAVPVVPLPAPAPVPPAVLGPGALIGVGGFHDHQANRHRRDNSPDLPDNCPNLHDNCPNRRDNCPNFEASLHLEKTANVATLPEVDEVIDYTFTVTNGCVRLTNVVVKETSFSGSPSPEIICDPPQGSVLEPSGVMVCHAFYTVTQEDDDAGEIGNEAKATGSTANGSEVSDSASLVIPRCADTEPLLTLTKTANVREITLNTVVNYTFTVTSGSTPIDDVSVVDVFFSGSPAPTILCNGSAEPFDLPANTSVQCTASYTVTQADINRGELINIAQASGTVNGNSVESSPAFVVLPGPPARLTLLKQTNLQRVPAVGTDITYQFLVQAGPVDLSDVTLVETDFTGNPAFLTDITCEGGSKTFNLPANSEVMCEATYTVQFSDFDAGPPLTNTAQASGFANGNLLTSTDDVALPKPLIAFISSAGTLGRINVGRIPVGGILGANAFCQNLADNVGYPGTFLAWISDNETLTSNPKDTWFHTTKPWALTTGPVIANGWTDLTDGILLAPLNVDEMKNPLPLLFVWTDTAIDGSLLNPDTDCASWSDDTANSLGRLGASTTTDFNWTNHVTGTCITAGPGVRVYCFQQEPLPPPL